MILLLDRDFDAAALAEAEELDIRNVSTRNWDAVLSIRCATKLSLYHVMTTDLVGIECLTSVEKLSITWATKITGIDPVFQMAQLKTLSISDSAKLRSIAGIENLTALTELHLSGNLGSLSPMMRLVSIGPVAKIASLHSFSLLNAKLDDDDITVLADCKNLRTLNLSNQFERQQFAYLAKNLNDQLNEPINSHRSTSIPCKKCDGETFLVTGRRMPLLCGTCDRKRLSKAEDEFAKLTSA